MENKPDQNAAVRMCQAIDPAWSLASSLHTRLSKVRVRVRVRVRVGVKVRP